MVACFTVALTDNRLEAKAGGGPSNLPAQSGAYYQDTVPDTLDLAERARLGLTHFTGLLDEKLGYEMPLLITFYLSDPPLMQFSMNDIGCCQPKALEAMAYLRLMTGSKQDLDREKGMIDMMTSYLGEDGLYWIPGSPEKPWLGIQEPFVYVLGQGRMLMAMIAWYQYTGDPSWKERIDRLVNGMDQVLVVHKDDYAYFPSRGLYDQNYLRSCYTRKGWKDTSEPANEKAGEEGSLFNQQGAIPSGLTLWYKMTGNKQSLRLAGELVRFLAKPKFWADVNTLTPADVAKYEHGGFPLRIGSDYPDVIGAEHAHWQGHYHGYVNTLRAILDYALVANDSQLKAFVRDGYEWTRQAAFPRIGYVGDLQGCGLGRLIGLAVKLSEAGMGDYWEDVDQYILNQGTEMQVMPEDRDYLENLAKGKPAPPAKVTFPGDIRSTDHVVDKAIGGFTGLLTKDCVWLCCSPHGSMGLYYAWDGILQYDHGTARVNLLLNRASPEMDIYSYLPYEGKVVLRNKQAREALVRIPLWADRSQVRTRVGSREVPVIWLGNYIRVDKLKPQDQVTIEFPMRETVEKWTVPKSQRFLSGPNQQVFTCRFRGNTLVEITPSLYSGNSLEKAPVPRVNPLYQRRAKLYESGKAPMKEVTRFVSPGAIEW